MKNENVKKDFSTALLALRNAARAFAQRKPDDMSKDVGELVQGIERDSAPLEACALDFAHARWMLGGQNAGGAVLDCYDIQDVATASLQLEELLARVDGSGPAAPLLRDIRAAMAALSGRAARRLAEEATQEQVAAGLGRAEVSQRSAAKRQR